MQITLQVPDKYSHAHYKYPGQVLHFMLLRVHTYVRNSWLLPVFSHTHTHMLPSPLKGLLARPLAHVDTLQRRTLSERRCVQRQFISLKKRQLYSVPLSERRCFQRQPDINFGATACLAIQKLERSYRVFRSTVGRFQRAGGQRFQRARWQHLQGLHRRAQSWYAGGSRCFFR